MKQQWWMMFEDDQVDVMAVDRALQRLGHRVDLMVAPNGHSPSEQLRECTQARGGAPPHLILVDINLPLGGGHQTLAVLKQDPAARHLPVVVISTSDRDPDVRLAFEAGAAGYFVKPPGFENFVDVIDTVARYWSLSLPPGQLGETGQMDAESSGATDASPVGRPRVRSQRGSGLS